MSASDLAELAENGGAQAGRVDHPDRRRRRLRRALDRRDRSKPLVRDRRDADMRLPYASPETPVSAVKSRSCRIPAGQRVQHRAAPRRYRRPPPHAILVVKAHAWVPPSCRLRR